MKKWEYATLISSNIHFRLTGPPGKFSASLLEEWLRQDIPKIREPRVKETDTGSYAVDKLGGWDWQAAMALLQRLGSEGWEAIDVSRPGDYSWYVEAWFKRPIP